MGLFDFLDPGSAYDDASAQYQKYYGQGENYLKPYWQAGMNAEKPLFGAGSDLMDPTKLTEQWSNAYQESPLAREAQERAKTQGMDIANSMGLGSSTPALGAITSSAGNIGEEDKQNFMNDMMKKYLSGTNIMQNIFGQGANAAGGLASLMENEGNAMGQSAYGAQQSRNNMFHNIMKNIFGGDSGSNSMGGTDSQGPYDYLSEGEPGGSGGGSSEMFMKALPAILAAL